MIDASSLRDVVVCKSESAPAAEERFSTYKCSRIKNPPLYTLSTSFDMHCKWPLEMLLLRRCLQTGWKYIKKALYNFNCFTNVCCRRMTELINVEVPFPCFFFNSTMTSCILFNLRKHFWLNKLQISWEKGFTQK